MTTTAKPTTDPTAWMDEPIRADKWANLHFSTTGESEVGIIRYNSEEGARKGLEIWVSQVRGKPWRFSGKDPLSVCRPWSTWSHAIQIPVKS